MWIIAPLMDNCPTGRRQLNRNQAITIFDHWQSGLNTPLQLAKESKEIDDLGKRLRWVAIWK